MATLRPGRTSGPSSSAAAWRRRALSGRAVVLRLGAAEERRQHDAVVERGERDRVGDRDAAGGQPADGLGAGRR